MTGTGVGIGVGVVVGTVTGTTGTGMGTGLGIGLDAGLDTGTTLTDEVGALLVLSVELVEVDIMVTFPGTTTSLLF